MRPCRAGPQIFEGLWAIILGWPVSRRLRSPPPSIGAAEGARGRPEGAREGFGKVFCTDFRNLRFPTVSAPGCFIHIGHTGIAAMVRGGAFRGPLVKTIVFLDVAFLRRQKFKRF